LRSVRLIATLAALAALSGAGAALAAGLGKARYTGTTSDNTAVRLRLSSDGKRVAKLRIFYTVNCDNGQAHKTFTDIFNLGIGKRSTFSGSGTYQGQQDHSTNDFKISGKVGASSAKGKFSLKATDETKTVHCNTGTVSWTASRVK
jgi:hypothetical protein